MSPWFLVGIVLSALLGATATVTSSMVLFNLRSMNKRIETLEANQQIFMQRKSECQQEFVPVGQFIRDAGYTRKRLDDVVEAVTALTGKLDVVSQLPQIAGQIASQTVREMLELTKKG